MIKLHCDDCNRELGEYLFGKGGIEEIAHIGSFPIIGLPNIVCFRCIHKVPIII